MTPALQIFAVIIAATFLLTGTSASLADTIFSVTVSSEMTGGVKETLCVTVHEPTELICMNVTLGVESKSILILEEEVEDLDFYQCVDFKVPEVTKTTVAKLTIALDGETSLLTKSTKILIKPPKYIHIVVVNQPIFKPGQTVKFRIASIDFNFMPVKRLYKTVVIEDPNSNRIAQWLDKLNDKGIEDFFLDMSPDAVQGTYRIIAETDKVEQISQTFVIEEFVLPKFEVTLEMPSAITLLDREITFKICGKYTFGQPVIGSVKANFCRKVWSWYRRNGATDSCMTYNMTTDVNGCATQKVNMTQFFPTKNYWYWGTHFALEAQIEEKGTGVILKKSKQVSLSYILARVKFVGLPQAYKPGLPFEGLVKVTDSGNQPISKGTVFVTVNNKQSAVLETNEQGLASFSLNTSTWKTSASLRASLQKFDSRLFVSTNRRPTYYSAYSTVTKFYSESGSFLKLMLINGTIPCRGRVAVRAKYIIQGKELKEDQKVLKFFFLVMSKGGLKECQSISVDVEPGVVNKGEVSMQLRQVTNLAPYAQVAVYTVLPNDETVADTMDYPVQLCLNNQVSMKFSSVIHLPAEKTKLSLKAHPGSLCSVRAIDLSVLLLQPEKELTVGYMYSRLPVQRLSGYSYGIRDSNLYPCIFPTTAPPTTTEPQTTTVPPSPTGSPNTGTVPTTIPDTTVPMTTFPPWQVHPITSTRIVRPPQKKDDTYRLFEEIGLKLLTNSDVTKPYHCRYETVYHYGTDWDMMPFPTFAPTTQRPSQPTTTAGTLAETRQAQAAQREVAQIVRRFFPETWIWDLVKVGNTGSVEVEKTVPDTITKWVGGALCVSHKGLGISPNVGLTAFKPFFVSLTLPYSVIRGEVLTLKATVFNYLSKCIMVSVTLARSDEFTYRNCDGCQYSGCLCAGESKTFSWIVTPSALGQVDVMVSAEAMETKALCGSEKPVVPEKGKIDTVVRKLLVEPEGTPETVSHGALLCPQGKPVSTNIALELPTKIVEGSARASVIVLGDLMGGALKNLDNLLRMPYGCGEQNMLKFAPNIYIVGYLNSTNQLTDAILTKAKRFLESGYQRQLTYKHHDGSYSAFGSRDASGNTWLSAFVMKSFGGASGIIFIDGKHILQTRAWLSGLQRKDGCIQSVGKLFHNAMKGGVSDEVSLTAYVTAAVLELNPHKDTFVKNCLKCLKTAVNSSMDNLYTTAVMAYAFTLAGDTTMRNKLITQLHAKSIVEGASIHWEKSKPVKPLPTPFWRRPVSIDVEMTSYVLLALLSGPSLPGFDIAYSAGIVRWLVQQQNPYGGFSSTQDTVVALQALAKYSSLTFSKDGKVTVKVSPPKGKETKFTVDATNRLLYQEENLKEVPGEYKVTARGQGCVLVQMALYYNIPPPPDSTSFIIYTNVTSPKCEDREPQFTLNMKVSYNGDRIETNMVIINIKLLSGHTADKNSISWLEKSPSVKRVEEEDGHIIVYLDELKKGSPESYTVILKMDQSIKNLKPAPVKVYDYYQTNDVAVAEYASPCKGE